MDPDDLGGFVGVSLGVEAQIGPTRLAAKQPAIRNLIARIPAILQLC
jgi:hypothetical protein